MQFIWFAHLLFLSVRDTSCDLKEEGKNKNKISAHKNSYALLNVAIDIAF